MHVTLKSKTMRYIVLLFISLLVAGFFWLFSSDNSPIGVELPSGTAVFETSLASSITDSATTMTLTANSIRGGGSLSGYECFTIDEGSAQAEFVCGNVSGTTVSDLERGISPADGVTEDSDLQFSHRRGASVKITDFPLIQRLQSQNNGDGTFPNALSYASGVTPTGNNHLTDVEYVASVVNGGSISFDQLIVSGNAGETVATGTIVYKSLADGEWYKADADDQSTFVDRVVGITQGAGVDGGSISGGILLRGVDSNQSGLTANTLYFLSTTAGSMQTATSGQALGISFSTTEIYFDTTFVETYFVADGTYTGDNTFTGTSTFTGDTPVAGLDTYVAGATINGASTPVPVYFNETDDEVYAVDGNATGTIKFIGFAVTNGTDGNPIQVQTEGIVDGFTNLFPGEEYYVQDTAGAISSTTGTYSVLVGVGVSDTELLIRKGKLYASGQITVDSDTNYTRNYGFRADKITFFAGEGSNSSVTWSSGTWISGYGNKCIKVTYNEATFGDTQVTNCVYFVEASSDGNNHVGTITSVSDTGFTLNNNETGTAGAATVVWVAEGTY